MSPIPSVDLPHATRDGLATHHERRAHRAPLPGHRAGAGHAWPDWTAVTLPRQMEDDVDLISTAFGDGALAPDTARRLARTSFVVEGPGGELPVASPRSPVPAWWLVRHGTVVVGSMLADGEFVERRRLHRGQWLDVAGALSGSGSWLQPARLLGPAALLALPISELARACAHDEHFALAFARVLAGQARDLQGRLVQVSQVNVLSRLAAWLLEQAARHDALQPGDRWLLSMPKGSLAGHLGTTAETLSRSLAKLSREGCIQVEGYSITMLQPERLQAVARAPARRCA